MSCLTSPIYKFSRLVGRERQSGSRVQRAVALMPLSTFRVLSHVEFCWELNSWLPSGCFLALPACVRETGSEQTFWCFLIKALISTQGPHPLPWCHPSLATSQGPRLQKLSQYGFHSINLRTRSSQCSLQTQLPGLLYNELVGTRGAACTRVYIDDSNPWDHSGSLQ